jgi:hypothetical protein
MPKVGRNKKVTQEGKQKRKFVVMYFLLNKYEFLGQRVPPKTGQ